MSRPTVALAALCALTLLPTVAHAQRDDRRVRTVRISINRGDRASDREITMSVGALRSNDDDVNLPMAALRADWRVRRWLRSEFGVSYATGSTERSENSTLPVSARTVQIATTTVGLRAELPSQVFRPYVGVAAGLALRYEEDGAQYVRTTMAFPAGVRLSLSDRVALRAEARFRFDSRRSGGETVRVEQTGGLSVAF